jgi:hypothetical protein
LKIVCLCFSQPDLSEKRLNTFHFGLGFYNLNNYCENKTESANGLKFWTKCWWSNLSWNGTFIWKKYFQTHQKPQWSPFKLEYSIILVSIRKRFKLLIGKTFSKTSSSLKETPGNSLIYFNLISNKAKIAFSVSFDALFVPSFYSFLAHKVRRGELL